MAYTVEEICEVGPPVAMSLLVETADLHKTVGYEDVARFLAKKIDKRFSTAKHHIGNVAGILMDRILEKFPNAPPINSLIVAQSGEHKGLPGHGADWYVGNYLNVDYEGLSIAKKRGALRPVHDSVWNFQNWRNVASRVFGAEFSSPAKPVGEEDGKSRRLGFGGPAESEEHLKLKQYVAAHPRRFRAPEGCVKGETEKRLDTFDEIDVWFMFPGEELAVEVKSVRSDDLDRQRGIFQCVKYRSLLTARAKIDKTKSKVRARLVSEVPLTPKLERWARVLGVEFQLINPLK